MSYHPSRMRRFLCKGQPGDDVSFRLAQSADADRMISWLRSDEAQRHIHWRPASPVHGRRRVTEWIKDPRGIVLLILHRGKEVGFLQLEHLDNYRRMIWLSLIVLAPECIGKGIGTKALRLLMTRIHETDAIDRMLLAVNADNARAISAYRRLGFIVIDHRGRVPAHDGRNVAQNIMECAVRWHSPSRPPCYINRLYLPAHMGY